MGVQIEQAWVYELRLGSKLKTLLWMLERGGVYSWITAASVSHYSLLAHTSEIFFSVKKPSNRQAPKEPRSPCFYTVKFMYNL
jgi:hypothetical protein